MNRRVMRAGAVAPTAVLCLVALVLGPVLVGGAVPAGHAASAPAHLVPLRSFDGRAERVVVAGAYAYVLQADRLAVVDVNDPTAPRHLRTLDAPGPDVAALAVSAGRLYVAHSGNVLSLLDLADPARPHPVGRYVAAAAIRHVAVDRHRAYLSLGPAGLEIVDVGNATAPSRVGQLAARLETRAAEVVGNLAYVAERDPWEAALRVVDLTDPTAPRELGLVLLPEGADHVAVTGTTAVVAGPTGGIWKVDVSNPARPTRRTFGLMPRRVRALALSGNVAFSAGAASVEVIPLGSPTTLDKTLLLNAQGDVRDVVVADGRLYIAAGTDGLLIYDVTTPAMPMWLGEARSEVAAAADLAVDDRSLFVVDGSRVLRVLDVSGDAPTWTARAALPAGYLTGLALQSDRQRLMLSGEPAATANCGSGRCQSIYRGGGLALFDTTDRGAPRLLAQRERLSVAAVAYQAEAALAIVRWATLPHDVYDERNSSSAISFDVRESISEPVIAAKIPSYFQDASITSLGDRVYSVMNVTGVFPQFGGLAIYTLPRARDLGWRSYRLPSELGAQRLQGVAADGTTVYLAVSGGLMVVDASNPSMPRPVAFLPMPTGAQAVAMAGGYAVVLDAGRGVVLVDISNPLLPEEVDVFPLPQPGERDADYIGVDMSGEPDRRQLRVRIHGDRVYVAFGDRGLYLFRLAPGARPTPVPTATATATGTATLRPSATPTASATERPTPTPAALYLPWCMPGRGS